MKLFRKLFSSLIRAAAAKLGLFVADRIDNHLYVHRNRITDTKPPRMSILQNEEFSALAEHVIESGRTLLRFQRLGILWQGMQNVCRLKLPAAEVGAYKGGSSYFIAAGFKQLCSQELPMHVFDTFEGHPPQLSTEFHEPHHKGTMFSDTSYDEVRSFLSGFKKVVVHRGDFTETCKNLPELTYSFVHLDADTYATTLSGLNYFFPRLARGGIIIVDDFGSGKCPGVAAAIKRFLSNGPSCQTWQGYTEQCIVIKIEAG